MEEEKKNKKHISKKALIIALVNVIVIAGAVIGAYQVFYTPEKRFERALAKAETALEEKAYEEARTQYNKALGLDETSLAARLGMLEAVYGMAQYDELTEIYEEYLEYIRGLETKAFEENKSVIMNIYLFAEKVYAGDEQRDTRVAVYEEGYAKASDNRYIKDKLIEDYLAIAATYFDAEDMENEVVYYNKVLDIDSDNETARTNRSTRVTEKLRECIDGELFDEADAIIAKYIDSIDDIDFEALIEENTEKRTIHDAKYDLLSTVYEYMSNKDYESMLTVDGTSEANFVSMNIDGSVVYTPDEGVVENYTGTAAAMFIFKDEAYYFYYGEFVDGVCSGNGTMFIMTSAENKSYYVYDGEWSMDKPNGKGTVMDVNEYDEETAAYVTREENGSFVDGLQNGEMSGNVVINSTETYTGSWSTENGVPKDVSSSYADYPFSVPEGKVLYAVFLNSDGSVGWGSWVSKNGHLGVIPFVN